MSFEPTRMRSFMIRISSLRSSPIVARGRARPHNRGPIERLPAPFFGVSSSEVRGPSSGSLAVGCPLLPSETLTPGAPTGNCPPDGLPDEPLSDDIKGNDGPLPPESSAAAGSPFVAPGTGNPDDPERD